jgi:hypothetical protein
MSILHIRSLKCYETEDWTGADECRLEIYVDGNKTVLRHSLNDNETWQVDRQFEFSGSVQIKLYDEDSPDEDDHLGTITLGKDSVQNATGKFTGDDANYSLFYDVFDNSSPSDPSITIPSTARLLKLIKLDCKKNEDITGYDELRFEVYIDGVFREKICKDLKKKQTWDIDMEYTFSHIVQLKLWDEDFGWGDGDDFLGEALINTNLGENKSVKFTLDDCDYTLTYSVFETTLFVENDVNQLLNEFEKSSAPGVWPKIIKDELIKDIRAIVAAPLRVNQGRAPLCGPAAIVYELVRREPSRFVRICRSLYEKGSFQTRSKTYSASSKLRNSKVRSGVTPCNWMIMATIVEYTNLIFNIEADSWDGAFASLDFFLKEWTYEILLFDRVEWAPTYAFGEFDAIKKAKKVYDNGGVAFLFVHSALVGNPPPLVSVVGTHWIVYAGNLELDEGKWYIWDSGHVKFDCYTWGKIKTVDVDEGTFEDYFFGVVTGQR